VLHEMYFENLGNGSTKPNDATKKLIEHSFSFDAWIADSKACLMSAHGWLVTVYDYSEKKLFNNLIRTEHDVGLFANVHVMIAVDAWEHAYFADYQTGKAKYVENVLWVQSDVLFVTINLPGGSNNDNDPWYKAPARSPAQDQEIAERTGADLRWLDVAFSLARVAPGIKGVVVGTQADMWDNEAGPEHQAAYEPFVQSLATHTTQLGRPVLMFNGDSHIYLSDNPLSGSYGLDFMHPGYHVPNFHQVIVHGSTFPLEWLKLTIDPAAHHPNGPAAFGPFSWEREIQP